MYLAQEMYDLILCTYFPHEVTSFTGQSRTKQMPMHRPNFCLFKSVNNILSSYCFLNLHVCLLFGFCFEMIA